MAPVCGNALVVEADGGVYACDHYVFSQYRLGSIADTHLGELAGLPAQVRFGQDKQDRLPAQCRSCPWLSVCNGGCPKDRFALSENGEPGLNHLCSGLRRFFSYVQPAVKLLTLLSEKGLDPPAIMAELRAQLRSKWKGIGRNALCLCGSNRKAKNCCLPRLP